MFQDLKHAARMLAARPGWTSVAVLSLVLGIGVNSTAFSVADALFLRPLPVAAPEEIAKVDAVAEGQRTEGMYFVEYRELARTVNAFAGMTAYSSRGSMLRREGESELMSVGVVDGNFFEVLGLQAQVGRTLRTETDSSPDGAATAVMSYSLWQRRFGGDARIAGKTIQLNDAFVTVVGVMGPTFSGLQRGVVTDLWLSPAAWALTTNARSDIVERQSRQFEVLGRLKPGVSPQEALAQVAAVGRRFAAEYPAANKNIALTSKMVSQDQAERAKGPVMLMLMIVGLVLWIACGNVAGLLVAQAEGRRREIGIRQALGATRARLVRQMITESAVLAVLGACGGLVLARWLLGVIPALLPRMPFVLDLGLRIDGRVFGYTLAATMLTVLLFGLAPAMRASKEDLVPALRGESGKRPQWRFLGRSAVVVAQIGLAVVLLNTAGLLLRSFLATRAERPGFDAARNVAGLFMHTGRVEGGARIAALYEGLRAQAAALPGVRRATYARRLPMWSSGGGATMRVEFPGLNLPEEQRQKGIRYNEVGPGYFETLGTRVLRGRMFGAAETADGPRVVMVSEAFARRYFPGGDVLGQTLRVRGKDTSIVGVVEDARINSIHEPAEPFLYVPFVQMPAGEAMLLVETAGEAGAMVGVLKKLVKEHAPEAVVISGMTMRDHMEEVMFEDWIQAVLSSGVAGLGVALSAVGLFAAVSFAVGRRLREFGVRMALGAQRADVLGLVLRQAFLLAGLGALVGLGATLAASKVLQGLLHGVQADDGLTLAGSVVVSMVVALAASLAPARRAVTVDPMVTLRYE
jgi:predicted permease